LRSSSICPRRLFPLAAWVLGILPIQTAYAIDPHRTISQYVRERWGPDNGFPKGPVYAINQTPDGYLWIGTERGLVRFDGRRFVLMQSGNPELPTLSH
jgi:ligand-binding sensor domain-containing protein